MGMTVGAGAIKDGGPKNLLTIPRPVLLTPHLLAEQAQRSRAMSPAESA